MISHAQPIPNISSGVEPKDAEHLIVHLEDEERLIAEVAVKIMARVGSEINGLSHQVLMTGTHTAEQVIKKACDLIEQTGTACRVGLFCDHDHFSGYKGTELAQGIMRELETRGLHRAVTAVGFSGRANFDDVKDLWRDIGPLYNKVGNNPIDHYKQILADLFPNKK